MGRSVSSSKWFFIVGAALTCLGALFALGSWLYIGGADVPMSYIVFPFLGIGAVFLGIIIFVIGGLIEQSSVRKQYKNREGNLS